VLADAGCSDVIAKLIMPYSLLKLSDDMRFDSKRAACKALVHVTHLS